MGYQKRLEDAIEFYKFKPFPKKSFSLLLKMFVNIGYVKDYQIGYKIAFKEIVQARKMKKTLQDISSKEKRFNERTKEMQEFGKNKIRGKGKIRDL